MNHSLPEPIIALVHLEGIISSSRWGKQTGTYDRNCFIILAGNDKINSKHSRARCLWRPEQNGACSFQRKTESWHFKSHYKETSEAKKDTTVYNKHAYSSKKNHHECLSAFTGYSFTVRNNATRIAPARKQRSCGQFPRNQDWWENVWRNYSEKRFKKTFRVYWTRYRLIVLLWNKCACLYWKTQCKNSKPAELRLVQQRIVSSYETNMNRICTIHDLHDRWDEPMSSPWPARVWLEPMSFGCFIRWTKDEHNYQKSLNHRFESTMVHRMN